jgi:hypothetical protein
VCYQHLAYATVDLSARGQALRARFSGLRTTYLLQGVIVTELLCVWVLVSFATLFAQDSGFAAAILRLSVSVLRFELDPEMPT